MGVVASGAKSFYAPVIVFKEAEKDVREESLAVIRDRVTGKTFLGVIRWLSRMDPLLPATQRSGVVDNPRLAEAGANVPFETCYVRIIGELRGGRLEPSSEPPTPRSEVLAVESPEDLKLEMGPGLVVGRHKYSGVEIPLDPRYLPYHVGVVGATGTGKSRLVKALVDEVLAKTDWRVIVFDHSGVDYVSYYPDKVVDASGIMPDPLTLGEIIAERADIKGELADYVISALYAYVAYAELSRRSDKPERPARGLRGQPDCDLELVEGFDFTNVEKIMVGVSWSLSTLLDCVRNVCESLGARRSTRPKLALLLSTYAKSFIESLNRKKLTVDDVLGRVFSERLVVVDLSTVDIRIRRYVVKATLERLWDIVDERRERPRVLVVVDEAHNYACRECGASLPAIERTAREGRKWEIGLVLASQRMVDFSTDIRNNVNTFFFSRLQTPGDFENLRGVLDLGGITAESLSVLDKREFFFAGLGNPLRFPVLIRVKDVGEPPPRPT